MKTLSDEIIEDCDLGFPVLDVDKVKQFIKDLKEVLEKSSILNKDVISFSYNDVVEEIDKLAGDKLTGEEKSK